MVITDNFQLRYTNCWEDTDLLLQHLAQDSGATYLSVASGGGNSLSILTLDPGRVDFIDVNPLQIYLTELKMCAIHLLSYKDCCAFLGYTDQQNRWEKYRDLLAQELSVPTRQFWDNQKKSIDIGIINAGRVARFFRIFAGYVFPLIHSKSKSHQLLARKSVEQQVAFYHEIWNNRRWKAFFKIFFHRSILRFIAPDPDFLNYVNDDMSTYLFKKTEEMFCSTMVQNNLVAQYLLTGEWGSLRHHYMRPENYACIKSRLDRVHLHVGFAEDLILKGIRYDGCNLSNIFEYTTMKEFEQLTKHLASGGNSGCRYVYWNILLPRIMEHAELSRVLDSSKESDVLDRVWLYRRCLVEHKH